MINEALQRGYFGSIGPVSVDYFRDELSRFREVIGSTRYTLEQKDLAFRAIGIMWLNLDPGNPNVEIAESWWASAAQEWAMRRSWEIRR